MRWLTVLLLSLIVAAGAFTQDDSQSNLLKNPGFEKLNPENEKMPADWHSHGGHTDELFRHITEDPDLIHSGKRAMFIVDDYTSEERVGYNEATSGIVQRVDDINPGDFYNLTCMAKCLERDRDNAAWLQLRFMPSGEQTNTHLNSAIGEWQEFSAAGKAPEDTTHAYIYIKTLHMASSRYAVDDFRLERMSEGPDDQRLALFLFGSEGVARDEVHQPNLHTPLAADGQPAAHIVVPDADSWHDLGIRLRDKFEARTGATLEIIRSTGRDWEPLRSDETTIAIGNLGNNFVVERMWLQRYQEVNDQKPGPGEYVLQTIPEPYDCPDGKNVLLVGASDLEGAERGVDRLLEILGEGQDLSVDEWILEISGVDHLDDAQAEELINRDLSKFWLRDFHSAVHKYRDTGDPAWAKRARYVLRRINERYLKFAHDPDVLKYWPEPTAGGTHRIYWPEETSSDWIGTMWDFFEEAPVLTDDDRWRGANSMLNALHDLPRHVSRYGMFKSPETTWPVVFNHSTFPLIGMYYLGRHFDRFYPDVDSSRIDEYLERCENCFQAQKKSFKPSEDATGYCSIVPRHTINYTLSEGDYSYFDDGHVRMFADYTAGICDNTGDPANFGDSSWGRGTYTRNLDWALWYYDDPHLQWWLERIERENWENPFNADLQAEPWEELAGVTSFPLTEAIYEWTTETGAYGASDMPPNVPQEKCFDKLSFRENLDEDGQFFLIDGYARGGHLHYDGNAINKYYADGEDWLMDGDYLVRNTTDHTMLSVVRDGRADKIVPPCAALEHLADTENIALTRTSLYDYNGVDWQRNVFWLKGGPICLIDHCTAAESGDYSLECIFKMIDQGEHSDDGIRSFRLLRESAPVRGLTVVENPEEGVEKAVRFDGSESALSFPLEIPAGEYRANLIAKGLDSGTDSFYLSIDDGDPVPIHISLGKFGRSYNSGVNPKVSPMPTIAVHKDGTHLVKIWLREKPGVFLDRMEFLDEDGKIVADIEAEDARDAEASEIVKPPDKLFHLRNTGHSRMVQSTRINHKRDPIRYVHHKFGGPLQKGEAASNQALFYNERVGDQEDWDLRRIDTNTAVLVENERPRAVLTVKPADVVNTDAAMAWIGQREIVLVDATSMEGVFGTGDPADVRIDLNDGTIRVHAEGGTEIWVRGFDAQRVTDDDGGELVLTEDATATLRRSMKDVVRDLGQKAAFGQGGESPVSPAEGLNRTWEVEAPIHEDASQPTIEMETHDLEGDGTDETLAIRGRYLTCINADGTVRWQFDGTDELYAVGAYDIDDDGELEVFCGGKSKILYVLDADGSLIKEHPIETYWRVSRTTIHEPRLDDVVVGDFNNDGEWEACLGTVDGFTQVINSDFSQRWIFGETNHGTTEIHPVDVDDDGVQELAVGNRYGKLFVLEPEDGSRAAYRGSELGDVQMRVADLDGDGTFEMVNGSSTGALKVGQVGSREVIWQFPNYGYTWRDIKVADFVGDGSLEVACASDTGYVYILDADGETLAKRNLHSAVLDLAVVEMAGAPMIAAGCLSGMIYLFDGDLDEIGRMPTGAQVNWVSAVRTSEGPQIVAGLEDGRVVAATP